MEAKDWIGLAGLISTMLTALFTQFLSSRREAHQQKREDELRRKQVEREDSLRERERVYAPQIEFNIACNFHGPQLDSYVVEVLLTVNNRGRVKQDFRDVLLRIRGIEKGQPLTCWEERKPRLLFPKTFLKDVKVVPESITHFFAEPGETQMFTYVTKIPTSIAFILVYATFAYDSETTHDAERVFTVRPSVT